MAKSCVYTPKKGKEVYRQLTRTLGHNTGTKAFLLAIHPEFISEYKNSLSLTAERVPTFDSILNNKEIQSIIEVDDMKDYLESEIGKTEFPDTEEGYKDALKRAEIFNTQSEMRKYYTLFPIKTEEGYKLEISKRTESALKIFSSQQQARNLENKLISIASAIPLTHKVVEQLSGESNRELSSVQQLGKFLINIKNGLEGTETISPSDLEILVDIFKNENLINRALHYVQSLEEEDIREFLDKEGIEANEVLSDRDYNIVAGLMMLDSLENNNLPPVFKRAISKIMDAFSTFEITDISNAIDKANVDNESFISEVIENTNDTIEESFTSEALDTLIDEVARIQEIIEDLKIKELKRVNITNGSLDGLKALNREDFILSIKEYLTTANEGLSKVLTDLSKLDTKEFKERCNIARDAMEYSKGLSFIIAKLSEVLESSKFLKQTLTEEDYNTIRESLDNFNVINGNVLRESTTLGKNYFTELLRPIIGDKITISIEGEEKELSIEQLLSKADKDISIVSRLLDSAGNSNDVVLQAAHLAIKNQKDKARLKTIDVARKVAAMGLKAERAGITDFTFMYETDKNGNRTGRYISELDIAGYREAYNKMREALDAKYGKTTSDSIRKAKNKEINAWHKKNSVLTEDGYRPKQSVWKSEAFSKLNKAQKEFYQEFMDIKEALDNKLPSDVTNLTNAIKIRKDTWNRVKASNSLQGLFNNIVEAVKDTFIERSDNTEFGSKQVNTDLEGKPLRMPPLYYLNMGPNESANDLTDDIVGSLIAYAFMANNYEAMCNISDALELGRTVVHNREVGETSGDKQLYERVKSKIAGIDKSVPIPKNITEAEKLYDTLLESQVYNIYMKDYGTFKKTNISKNKFASFMLRVGSTTQLGLNSLAGISNAVNGIAMQNIEAAAGEFFNRKELAGADAYIMKHMASQAAEVGKRVKTNRLDLIFELFNVKQDYDKEIGHKKFDRRTILSRMFGPSVLYLYQTLGDQFLYGRSALAILDREKVIKDGKKMSLRDALEEVAIDNNDKSLGVELSYKGLKKTDGSDFTEDDIHRISRKIERVNQYCFGVYNNEDLNAARRTIAGRFLLQYRDWMRPAWNRRFAGRHYDVLLNMEREGYYVTGLNFTLQYLKDIRNGQLNFMTIYRNMSEHEQANMRRVTFEVSQFSALVAMVYLLSVLRWDNLDDEDKSWAESMIEYTMRRQITELGAVIPGPMVTEGFKILKSPVANVTVLENTLDLFKLLWPPNYADELEAGPYKGHSTAYKTFFNSPFGLQTKNIRRTIHPEEGIPYLKQ